MCSYQSVEWLVRLIISHQKSFLVNNGRSIYEVQRILGHTQIKTTQRYAHLSQDSLLAAANEISKALPMLATMPNRIIDVPLVQIGY